MAPDVEEKRRITYDGFDNKDMKNRCNRKHGVFGLSPAGESSGHCGNEHEAIVFGILAGGFSIES